MDRFLSRATVTTTVRAMVTMTTTATTPPTIAAVLSDWQAHVLSVESACEGRSETSYTHIEYSLYVMLAHTLIDINFMLHAPLTSTWFKEPTSVIYYPHGCAVMVQGYKGYLLYYDF